MKNVRQECVLVRVQADYLHSVDSVRPVRLVDPVDPVDCVDCVDCGRYGARDDERKQG